MQLHQITLQNFRNLPLVRLTLAGRRQFLVGANGQGKTNLLESLGLLTALRSFRTAESGQLIRQGQTSAALAIALSHERLGATTVTIRLEGAGKEVMVDQEKITRLGDFIGRFPTVVFSSQDQLLIRGAPAVRRRWLDLALAALDAEYLRALQTYHRALAARNLLLKRDSATDAELLAFEKTMAPAAACVVARRAAGLAELAGIVTRTYAAIALPAPDASAAVSTASAVSAPLAASAADGQSAASSAPAEGSPPGLAPETVGFAYAPDCLAATAAAFASLWAEQRQRDRQGRTTARGPQRDDFEFLLRGAPARSFASEGQQRLLVLALRIAQADWIRARTDIEPVLLADDVLGELDPERRARFWSALSPAAQVIATGTAMPEGLVLADWQIFRVIGGTITEEGAVSA